MSIEDRNWMYQGWNDNGCHSQEWVSNTNAFLDNAFSIGYSVEKTGVACPCSDCCNRVRWRRHVMTMHLCKRGFMPGYTIWTEHGEHLVSEPTLGHEYNTAGWGRTVQSQFQSLQSFMEVRYDIQPSLFSFVPIELLSDYI